MQTFKIIFIHVFEILLSPSSGKLSALQSSLQISYIFYCIINLGLSQSFPYGISSCYIRSIVTDNKTSFKYKVYSIKYSTQNIHFWNIFTQNQVPGNKQWFYTAHFVWNVKTNSLLSSKKRTLSYSSTIRW